MVLVNLNIDQSSKMTYYCNFMFLLFNNIEYSNLISGLKDVFVLFVYFKSRYVLFL